MKKKTLNVLLLISAAIALGACRQQSQSTVEVRPLPAAEAGAHEMKTLDDRFSYAYGLDLAEKFKNEGIDLNVDLMAAAMQSVFKNGEKKMSPEEVAATMDMYREVHLREKEAERVVAADRNKVDGEAFLKLNATKEGVKITKSGLQYKILEAGNGGYKPTVDDEVKVHYRARFIDGKEFDDTHKRNQPYSVNAKMLINGWAEALQMMSKGAKWELYIPANLAYGEKGSPPHIGPNAVLIFEVELLDIQKS